jgi:hypothetical protein
MSYRRVVIYHKNSNQAGLPSFHLSRLGNDTTRRPPRSVPHSIPLAITFRLMLFQHSARSYFLGPVTVAPKPLRTFLDMFILRCSLALTPCRCFFPGIWKTFFSKIISDSSTVGVSNRC